MINLKITTNEKIYNLKVEKGINIKEILKKENINFIFPCNANGKCGNCKVQVLKNIQKPTRLEIMKLKKEELDNNFRLACNIYLKEDLEIYLEEKSGFNFVN